MVRNGAFSHKIDYIKVFQEILNLQGHYWFKSYGNFAEWVDFSYWAKWQRQLVEGLLSTGPTLSSFTTVQSVFIQKKTIDIVRDLSTFLVSPCDIKTKTQQMRFSTKLKVKRLIQKSKFHVYTDNQTYFLLHFHSSVI